MSGLYNSDGNNSIVKMNDSKYNLTTDVTPHLGNETIDWINVSKNLVVPSVMFFFGVLGNVTALFILVFRPSRDSKTTAFYNLVKALICMDLFGIVASSPVTIVVYIYGGILNTGGMPLCHYFSFILVMAGNATVFTVLVMAAERFMVTMFPFKYNGIVTPTMVNCSIAVVWGLAALTAICPIVGLGENVAPWPGTWCFFNYRSVALGGQILSYSYAISGLLAIIITTVLNLTVVHQLWRMRRSRLVTSSFRSSIRSSVTQSSNHHYSEPDSEKRMVIFLMSIIVVFTVCYAPLMVRIIISQLYNIQLTPDSDGTADDLMDLWALRLAALNQIFDPWVYIISRVTCCKISRNSDRDALSHSGRSYHTTHPTHTNDTQHSNSPQHRQTSERHIVRAIQNVRKFFTRRKFDITGKDSVTLPLKSPNFSQKEKRFSTPNGSPKDPGNRESLTHCGDACNGFHV